MNRAPAPMRFTARLQRPAQPKNAAWTFLLLPTAASAQLPTRGMVTVEGRFAGQSLVATLQPDGNGGHWLKVDEALREQAGVAVGDAVALQIAPVAKEPEPTLPADFKRALSAAPDSMATWVDITALARRDWIHWVTSGKKAETRVKRIAVAIDKLGKGQRRACCFDRSGQYGKGTMGAPEAAC